MVKLRQRVDGPPEQSYCNQCGAVEMASSELASCHYRSRHPHAAHHIVANAR